MRVHIICRDLDTGHILPRLAKTLAQHTGWSLSERPRFEVALNYYMVYIDYAERFPGWDQTPKACYFSHYETGTGFKERFWQMAAQRADYAIVTADQYGAMLDIPTAKVRPPVDPIFTPGKERGDKVGVSGIVDRSGRKRPELVGELAEYFPIVASGRGWPVKTKWHEWADMPAFYRSLGVYLCTSTIEGIPAPPLEALACGVPVVVPAGVGMLDDLDGPGVYRYGAEVEIPDMLDAAMRDKTPTEEIAATVADYTPQNWAADHANAFESFLYPAETGKLPQWSESSGMYCVGFGKPSRKCAVTCIQSFKRQMPDVPVAFAGTEPLNAGEDVFVQREDLDIGGRLAKLAVYDAAPAEWRYVLYLDADTEVIGDISFLFKLLADGWEALICRDMAKYHVARMMLRPDNAAETEKTLDLIGCGEVMQYNGGVFGFRRCANTERFFRLWNAEWQRYGARDQGALLRALYQNPLRLFVLGNQWNASDRYPPPVGDVAIWHHNIKARRWGGLIDGRLDSPQAWQAVQAWEAKNR